MQAAETVPIWLQTIEANMQLYAPQQQQYIATEVKYLQKVVVCLGNTLNVNQWQQFSSKIEEVIRAMPVTLGVKKSDFSIFKNLVKQLQSMVAKDFGYTLPLPFQNIGLLAGVTIGAVIGVFTNKTIVCIVIATVIGLLWGSFMDKWQQKNKKLIQ
jgi:ElaB/YqjD/DUF883 family membrane-anchored ribosome-binding protein